MVIISRLSVKYILTGSFHRIDYSLNRRNILIYGAGNAGRQLLTSLENNTEFKVIGFLDDDILLHRQVLLGKKIYKTTKLQKLIKSEDISLVLIAIPSISKNRKNQIIQSLSEYKLIVKTLPNVNDIIDEKISVSDIKDFLVDDLLDREKIVPNQKLLNKNIKLKTVLVTGAGGTIGSELCHQIIRLKPKKLILLELNEYSLYKIYEDIIKLNQGLIIVPLLGNIQEQQKIEKILKTFKVETIYHAAAYKHVPLVESNICEGVKNNVFGTLAIAKASLNQNIKNLVLISSDKAVRPTNIMGASKRFSELCMQALHKSNKKKDTNFSIVRFGNVINSSGSVIPKFKQQIKEGGPISLTHPEVTRYFMTISEAAQLVIQAGALGKNSEVFLLDMGKSIKIIDLIKRMVRLSGLTLQNDENREGDIKIELIGLRPGEKLFEELLIGNNPKKTTHPKIKKTDEPFIPYIQLEETIDELLILLNNQKSDEVKNLLNRSIKLYNSSYDIVDYIYNEELLANKKNNLLPKENQKKIVRIK